MTKKIIALMLCTVMLLSLTSCGMLDISIGGFSEGGVRDMLLYSLTTVMSSENYRIDLGMMFYYYSEQYQMLMNDSGADKDKYFYAVNDGNVKLEIVDKENISNGADADKKDEYKDVAIDKNDGTVDYNVIVKDDAISVLVSDISEQAMTGAIEYAKEVLIYCEYADRYGILLDEEDQSEIDEIMLQYVEDVSSGMLSVPEVEDNFIIRMVIGDVISEGCARRAIELSFLASKARAEKEYDVELFLEDHVIEKEYLNKTPEPDDKIKTRVINYAYFEDKTTAEKANAWLRDNGDYKILSSDFSYIWEVETFKVDDYMRGDMGCEAFDQWLYEETSAFDRLTKAPIYDESINLYIVAYYCYEGEEHGYMVTKKRLVAERMQAAENEMAENYGVETKAMGMKLFSYLTGVEVPADN